MDYARFEADNSFGLGRTRDTSKRTCVRERKHTRIADDGDSRLLETC